MARSVRAATRFAQVRAYAGPAQPRPHSPLLARPLTVALASKGGER